jgi:hypothetical protein
MSVESVRSALRGVTSVAARVADATLRVFDSSNAKPSPGVVWSDRIL